MGGGISVVGGGAGAGVGIYYAVNKEGSRDGEGQASGDRKGDREEVASQTQTAESPGTRGNTGGAGVPVVETK